MPTGMLSSTVNSSRAASMCRYRIASPGSASAIGSQGRSSGCRQWIGGSAAAAEIMTGIIGRWLEAATGRLLWQTVVRRRCARPVRSIGPTPRRAD
ncbi:hypothetical protein [Burkholderia glumae]|uniref:hypothetical protein n=1 Tax=Burkholderia glumae TaxID=337 RepID=UPI003B9D4779